MCIRNQILIDIRDNKKYTNDESLDVLIFDNNDHISFVETVSDDFDIEEDLIEKEKKELLHKAISMLEDDEKEILNLYLKEFNQISIAEILNVSQACVSRRLRKITEKLKRNINYDERRILV